MRKKTWFFKTGMLALALVFGLLFSACPSGSDDPTTYKVLFSAGEGKGTAPASQTVEAGKSITLPNQGSMTAPKDKIFAGWKADGKDYAAGDTFTVNSDTSFVAQWTSESTSSSVYEGFYNYPTGRVDPNGLLTVDNIVARRALLFNTTVEKENYLGTIEPLGSVQLKLPEEMFYTIVAVDKANYEEQQTKAAQYSEFTYYSNTQKYSINVSPTNTYGSGDWVFNNNTTFWVEIKKADKTQNYAVIAPDTKLVRIPIAMEQPYDYQMFFSKEIKYNGKVQARVETTDPTQSDTAYVTESNKTFTTWIYPVDVPTNIKPAVLLKNGSGKTVRVYYANQQKTNGGNDLVIASGTTQFISGFEINDNTKSIEFGSVAWAAKKKVPVDMPMLADKVYEITIPGDNSAITVVEIEGSTYYN